jgi:hypothetical protein
MTGTASMAFRRPGISPRAQRGDEAALTGVRVSLPHDPGAKGRRIERDL